MVQARGQEKKAQLAANDAQRDADEEAALKRAAIAEEQKANKQVADSFTAKQNVELEAVKVSCVRVQRENTMLAM